jgi:hypothetical protein
MGKHEVRTPHKLSDDLIKEACRLLAAGNYVAVVCDYLDITKACWYKWLRNGELAKAKQEEWGILDEMDELQLRFLQKTTRAKAKAIVKNVALIQDAAEVSWQAAAWWLERTKSDMYAPSQKITVVEGEEPLRMTDVKGKIQELKARLESKEAENDGEEE